MLNRIVAHFQDGKLLRGHTVDFFPARERFHLVPVEPAGEGRAVEVRVADLKGLFFVKDLKGDGMRKKSNLFDPNDHGLGRRVRVTFNDGEVLQGFTQVYQPGRTGFFLVPADKHANTERCYVVATATQEVQIL